MIFGRVNINTVASELKCIFLSTGTLNCIRKSPQSRHFSAAQLRILWNTFKHSSYITKSEAEYLAEILNVNSDKIMKWFTHKRGRDRQQQIKRTTEGKLLRQYASIRFSSFL